MYPYLIVSTLILAIQVLRTWPLVDGRKFNYGFIKSHYMSKILITGGTGLIGNQLTKQLVEAGHIVSHLSRSPGSNDQVKTYFWDPENGKIDDTALAGVDSIIHLAGARINEERWTDDRKKIILDSRIQSSALLFDACKRNNIRLKHFVSASAIGWYPLILSEELYDEESPAGSGFLADVCKAWEESADQFNEIADRVAKLRIGLVLTKEDGALTQISRPISFYLGAGLGSGKQYMSWIHLTDVCHMFMHVLDKNLSGVYNAIGPEQTRNQDFMQTVADVMDKPIILPNIPEFVIHIIFGPSAEMVLRGVPLSSKKIMDTGFEFEYPTLTSALFSIYW